MSAMIAGLVLLIFVPIIIGAELPNCLNPPVGQETVTFQSSAGTLIFSNIRSPETLLKVKDYPTNIATIIIKNSYLSHLPLVERSWTHKVNSFLVEDTCLTYLSPPQRKKYEENYQPFLKALEITSLMFTRVPFVYAFNWEDANPELLTVDESLFVSIPESLNKITRLQVLYVRNSGVKWIHRDAFKGLKSVDLIHLNNSSIEHLEGGTFQSFNRDVIIDLGGNKIMSIEPGALPAVVKMFFLSRNPLTNLDFKALEGVEIRVMNVCDTSLKCSCVGLEKVNEIYGTCLQENMQRRVWMKQLSNCKNLDYDEDKYEGCR